MARPWSEPLRPRARPDGMAAAGGNQLLPAARVKGHWEVVGKEYWTDRGRCVPEM